MLDSTAEGILSLDLVGRCTLANRSCIRMLGFDDEHELLGRRLHDVIHFAHADGQPMPAHACAIARSLRDASRTHNDEEVFWRKNGSSFPVEYWSYPIRDEGELTGVVVAFVDITERKQASEALLQSESSLANAQRIAHLGNWDWNIVTNGLYWSDEIYRIFGLTPQQFGATYDAFLESVHPDDRAYVVASVNAALEARAPYSIDHRIVLPDGTVRLVHEQAEVTFAPSGAPVKMSGTVQDITARKLIEEEIRKLNQELEQRVAVRTAQLHALNQDLESFSYSVSHDLRAPLRAIDGFSLILLEEHAEGLDEEGRRVLGVIRDNARKMGQLIDDILSFSRAGRKEIERQVVDMTRLTRGVYEELAPVRLHRQIRLELAELAPCWGDRAMLRQVLVNLLANAVKFTQLREQAVISVTSHLDGRDAVYTVRDNGAGFDMQFAHKLFNVFQRLHASDQFEGTGIGLAIVKRILTKHGGRIWAEGEVGEGATFSFTLPRADDAREGPS